MDHTHAHATCACDDTPGASHACRCGEAAPEPPVCPALHDAAYASLRAEVRRLQQQLEQARRRIAARCGCCGDD